jgi:hypothetical protein
MGKFITAADLAQLPPAVASTNADNILRSDFNRCDGIAFAHGILTYLFLDLYYMITLRDTKSHKTTISMKLTS